MPSVQAAAGSSSREEHPQLAADGLHELPTCVGWTNTDMEAALEAAVEARGGTRLTKWDLNDGDPDSYAYVAFTQLLPRLKTLPTHVTCASPLAPRRPRQG